MSDFNPPGRKQLILDAHWRSDVALRKLLSRELDIMQFNQACYISRQDVECLHDFRVALRHARVLLLRMPGVFPSRVVRSFARGLVALGKLTSACRDYDVMLENWAIYAGQEDAGCHAIQNYLQQQNKAARRRVLRGLQSARHASFFSRWRVFLDQDTVRGRMPHAAEPVAELAYRRLKKTLRKLVKKMRALDEIASDKTIHKLRISCKRLRYLIEYFHVLVETPDYAVLLPELKQLQDCLGAYQDRVVQQVLLQALEQDMRKAAILDEKVATALFVMRQSLTGQAVVQKDRLIHSVRQFLQGEALQACLA